MDDFTDVVIVGGGAAGVAASARLKKAGVRHLLLEARNRIGGRAHTVMAAGSFPVDLGCGWLHSARQNAWTHIAEGAGVPIDRSRAPWAKSALEINFPASNQSDYHRAFEALERRLTKMAEDEVDHPASTAMVAEDGRWTPLLNAFSGYYNGAPFDKISVQDYAAYEPTEDNWRLPDGYGSLISRFGVGLPVRLETPVTKIEHGSAMLLIHTTEGVVTARSVIIAVPTTVIANGELAFDPPLPKKRDAATALPLGHVNKVFLSLSGAEAFDADTLLYGRTDSEDTGSYTLRPMGRPMIEGFFGGELAGKLEAEPDALGAFAIDEICRALGTGFRERLRPLAHSAWSTDRWSQGAYSHARPGSADMRAVLAEPVESRLFFAGEACSPHAFSTAHGAYETGVAAADAAMLAVQSKPAAT